VAGALFRALVLGALLPTVGGFGCSPDTGVVELAWVFVDRQGEQIFPAGPFSLGTRDSCDLPGRIGDRDVSYDLQMELEVCDPSCEEGCGNEACNVVSPLRFPCEAWRGSDPDIPASDDPYRFTARALVVTGSEQTVCSDPLPTCIAVPGPRERQVEPGLVVDLQVYQVAVDVDLAAPAEGLDGDRALDLEGCGCA
jgi:hypothetical protein